MRRFLPFAALVGVALVLGCQDVGTGVVASDGAGPQFNMPGSISEGACALLPGKVFKNDHCHDGEEPTVGTMFDIDVTSGPGHVSFSGLTDPKRGGEIIVDEDDLTLSTVGAGAFFGGLTGLNCPLGASQTASLWIAPGDDHVHLFFVFEYGPPQAPAEYMLELLGDRPGNWPPTAPNNDVTIGPLNGGEWSVSSKGKNHRDACTGSGFGIVWEATVDPV